MKRLFLLALSVFSPGLFAQSIANVPQMVVAAYVSPTGSAGSWLPMLGGAGTAIPNVPTPAALFCSTDGTGNAGTWAPCAQTASWNSKGQPHMTFGGSSGTSFASTSTEYGATYTPTLAITITGFDIHLDTTGVGCATWPVVTVYDETAAAPVSGTAITFTATTDFHITASANIPASHKLAFGTTTAAAGCTTAPSSPHFNVEFVMQ